MYQFDNRPLTQQDAHDITEEMRQDMREDLAVQIYCAWVEQSGGEFSSSEQFEGLAKASLEASRAFYDELDKFEW